MGRVKDALIDLEDAGVENAFVEYETNGFDYYDDDAPSIAPGATELDMYGDFSLDDWF